MAAALVAAMAAAVTVLGCVCVCVCVVGGSSGDCWLQEDGGMRTVLSRTLNGLITNPEVHILDPFPLSPVLQWEGEAKRAQCGYKWGASMHKKHQSGLGLVAGVGRPL